jgi:hypothetical protein
MTETLADPIILTTDEGFRVYASVATVDKWFLV